MSSSSITWSCTWYRCVLACIVVPGDRLGRHESQTVANSKERRMDQGRMRKGRREFKRETVINAVQPLLIIEILEAAIKMGKSLRQTTPTVSLSRAPTVLRDRDGGEGRSA